MSQQFIVGQDAALHQCQGASCAECAGGIRAASPYRLQLDVVHAPQKDFRSLQFEGTQRATDGVLGPALWVRLFRMLEKTVESFQQVGSQILQVEFADQVGGFRCDEVVLMREGFSERIGARTFWRITECIERRDWGFEDFLAGHERKFTVTAGRDAPATAGEEAAATMDSRAAVST